MGDPYRLVTGGERSPTVHEVEVTLVIIVPAGEDLGDLTVQDMVDELNGLKTSATIRRVRQMTAVDEDTADSQPFKMGGAK